MSRTAVIKFDFADCYKVYTEVYGFGQEEADAAVERQFQLVAEHFKQMDLKAEPAIIVDSRMVVKVGEFDYEVEFVDRIVLVKE